jgi:hypothetical protein
MTFDAQYFDIGRLDRLSYRDTFVHHLDPRVKVIATMLFLVTVISFPKYEVAALAPFFLFPVLLMTIGEIPVRFILKKVLLVSPFAILIGVFNPFLDTGTIAVIAGIPISAGVISFLSILLKFALTVSAALLLIATTSFPSVCHALHFRAHGGGDADHPRPGHAIGRFSRRRHQGVCVSDRDPLCKNVGSCRKNILRHALPGVSGRHPESQAGPY